MAPADAAVSVGRSVAGVGARAGWGGQTIRCQHTRPSLSGHTPLRPRMQTLSDANECEKEGRRDPCNERRASSRGRRRSSRPPSSSLSPATTTCLSDLPSLPYPTRTRPTGTPRRVVPDPMDNPWGSPWASDEPTAEASPAATLPAGGAPASLDDAALPSPGALPAPSFASTTASAVDNGWGGSLNDGGWGGAEDLEREGWGAPAAAPAATPAASSSDEEDGTTEAELDFEPSPAPTPAPPPVSDEGQDDDDDASADSPVDLTPAVTTPDRTATPPVEPSPFASPPPSPPAGSPPAFPTSDSFNDFAPFSSPPALASSALAGAADDDPWGATASFDDGGDDDRGAWGSAAPVRADVDDDDAVPWKAESDSREREAAPLASQEEDEWAEARRRAAIRAQRAVRARPPSLASSRWPACAAWSSS